MRSLCLTKRQIFRVRQQVGWRAAVLFCGRTPATFTRVTPASSLECRESGEKVVSLRVSRRVIIETYILWE